MVAGLANLCNVSNSKIIRSKEAQSLFFYVFIFPVVICSYLFLFVACYFGGLVLGGLVVVFVGLSVVFLFFFLNL